MKKVITLFLLGSLITSTGLSAFAQTPYTVSNLTPDLNTIVENVKKECSLNPEQYSKFKNDYVLFLNERAKPNSKTQVLLFLLGTKVKPYLNADQFSKISKMIQEGRLTPKANTAPVTEKAKENVKVATVTPVPLTVSKSNIAELFKQLQAYMQMAPDKATQTLSVLNDYDAQITKIITENEGNPDKIKQLRDALNGQFAPKLKMHMTDAQLGTLLLAINMQDNILTGKNLSADQKVFLDNIRNKYFLNDVQTMAVILVMVQIKIRGDAIALLQKSNPQQASQEFIKLLQDVDSQLKSTLTSDQHAKVKSDIEKLMKGEKL
ncbi:MAG: hypothetical protein U0T69_05935 [Chitinophagales bacterium]